MASRKPPAGPDKPEKPKKPRKPRAPKRPGGMPAHEEPVTALVNVKQPDPREEARKNSMALCTEYGIEQMCDDIMDAVPLTHIAMRIGVPVSSFYRWVDLTPGAGERLTDARKRTAQAWEERAEEVIADAKDPFQLMKAKELAHHYRWRAACISPKFNPTKTQDEKTNDDPVAAMRELASRLPN